MEKPKKENPEAIADLFFDMVQSQKENNKNLIKISIIIQIFAIAQNQNYKILKSK